MKLAVRVVLLLAFILQVPLASAGSIVVVRSAHDVGETVNRLEAALRAKGVTIFARIDHAANAQRVGIALREAIVNAMHHGNLEAGSELRQRDDADYQALIERRRSEAPYRERRTQVTVTLDRDKAVYVVRDEGRGFDPSKLPDPVDPANMDKLSGRGLLHS